MRGRKLNYLKSHGCICMLYVRGVSFKPRSLYHDVCEKEEKWKEWILQQIKCMQDLHWLDILKLSLIQLTGQLFDPIQYHRFKSSSVYNLVKYSM